MSFHCGSDILLNFEINLAQFVAIPRKDRTPLELVGAGASLIAVPFLGALPFLVNSKSHKVIDNLFKSHFFLFSVRFTAANLWQTASRVASCSA